MTQSLKESGVVAMNLYYRSHLTHVPKIGVFENIGGIIRKHPRRNTTSVNRV